MNVFVVGTGRCGTVTFSKACAHAVNYSSGHETMAGKLAPSRWAYPPGHIEVDPHLSWMLGAITDRYPDAFYVHLQRKREEVVRSWFRRGILNHRGAAPLVDVIFQTHSRQLSRTAYIQALELLYDTMNANIQSELRSVRSMHVWLDHAKGSFGEFWKEIQAEGDFEAAVTEFDTRYNAGPK